MLVFDQLKKTDRPVRWLTVIILTGLGILLAGLWYHQVYASTRYVERLKTQSLRRVRYPALRGKILDRNQQPLAGNRLSHNIYLNVEALSPQFQEAFRAFKSLEAERKRAALNLQLAGQSAGWWRRLWGRSKNVRVRWTADELETLGKQARYTVVSNVIYQLGVRMGQPVPCPVEKKFHEHYATRKVVPMAVMQDLTPQQIALFHELPNRPPGLYLDYQPIREYPNRTTASHVLGYLRRTELSADPQEIDIDLEDTLPGLPDFEGMVGLEGAFDADLRGRLGIKSVIVNNLGYRQSEATLYPAEPGSNLVTTIDVRIQRAAERAFAANGITRKGAVVVLDPRNGDVLAMVSSPPFDPNDFVPSLAFDTWERLNDPEENIMLNRATFGQYTPGSIFKIVTGLAFLESGRVDPKELFRTQGFFRYNARTKPIRDLARPGDYDFHQAFIKSSNEYFIVMGLRGGQTSVFDMAQQFFLGQKTRLPLLQEESGEVPTSASIQRMREAGDPFQPGDFHYLCIGQGKVAVTAIQMAVMTAAVANGGQVYWPRVVERIEQQTTAPEKAVRVFPSAQVRGRLQVSPSHLEVVRQAMLGDVEEDGTGKGARLPGLKISGKTGTAEVDDKKKKTTWFVSFAPFDTPRYVVVVMVEVGGESGGKTCAPVARRIYEEILKLEAKG